MKTIYILITTFFLFLFLAVGHAATQTQNSNAYNFKNASVSESVNPQTGMISLSYPAFSIPGKHGLNLNLAIRYEQNDQDDLYQLGSGWSYGFTYYDITQNKLHLASGAVYQPDSASSSGLKYYKLKNINFYVGGGQCDAGSYSYRVVYLSGNTEYLDSSGRLIEIKNRYGDHVIFSYLSAVSKTSAVSLADLRLTKITDSYGNVVSFNYQTQGQVTVNVNGIRKVTYISSGELTSIIDAGNNTISIGYGGNGLPSSIRYPTGAYTNINYYISPLKNVAKINLQVVQNVKVCADTACANPSVTSYQYTDQQGHNYTGAPTYSIASNDALLEQGNSGYTYTTTITHNNTVIKETFDHLHLLMDKQVLADNNAGVRELVQDSQYTYPGETSGYQTLPANYQTPNQLKMTYYRLSDGSGARVQVQQMQYNSFGQMTQKKVFNSADTSKSPVQTITMCYDVAGSHCVSQASQHYGLLMNKLLVGQDGNQQESVMTLTSDGKSVQTVKQYGKTPLQSSLQLLQSVVLSYNSDYRVSSRIVSVPNAKNESGDTSLKSAYSYNDQAGSNERSVTFTDAAGHSQTTVYDKVTGAVLQKTDGDGNAVIYSYDNLGRLHTVSSQAQGSQPLLFKTITYAMYDRGGKNSKTITDNNTGLEEETTYDGLGRKLSVASNANDSGLGIFSNGLNTLATYTYYDNGQVATKTDADGTTSYAYDGLNRLFVVTHPNQSKTIHTYDQVANSRSSWSRGSDAMITATMTEQYNNINQLQQKSLTADINSYAVAPIVDQYIYNDLDKVSLKSDALQSTKLVHTDAGVVYSATSLPKTPVIANDGLTATMTYDPFFHHLIQKVLSNPNDASIKVKKGYIYSYNNDGLIKTVTNNAGKTQVYTYDGANHVLTKTDWSGRKFAYAYQFIAGKERLKSIDWVNSPDESNKHYHLRYDYYANGQIKDAYLTDKDNSTHQGEIAYSYYPDGKVKQVTYPDGKALKYTYNIDGKLASRTDALGHTTSFVYEAKTDHNPGLLKSVTIDAQNAVTYDYDSLGRLLDKTRANGIKTHYTYYNDATVKNITTFSAKGVLLISTSYTYNIHHKILTKTVTGGLYGSHAKTFSYLYDNESHLLQVQSCLQSTSVEAKSNNSCTIEKYSYDINGNVLTDVISGKSSNTYTYNNLDQLQTINGAAGEFSYDDNGNMLTDDHGNRYTYNAINQLIAFTDASGVTYHYSYYANGERATKSSGGQAITFYYDGNSVIDEVAADGSAYYLLGLVRESRAVVAGNTTTVSFYGDDAQGSTIDFNSSTGNSAYQSYSPYGEPMVGKIAKNAALSIEDNPFLYADYYYDAESGMYYLSARYYNPRLMRFIQLDSYHFMNRYAYGSADPVNTVDPTGHSWSSFWKGVGKVFKRNLSGIITTAALITVSAILEVSTEGAVSPLLTVAWGAFLGGASGAVGYSLGVAIDQRHWTFRGLAYSSLVSAAGGAAAGIASAASRTFLASDYFLSSFSKSDVPGLFSPATQRSIANTAGAIGNSMTTSSINHRLYHTDSSEYWQNLLTHIGVSIFMTSISDRLVGKLARAYSKALRRSPLDSDDSDDTDSDSSQESFENDSSQDSFENDSSDDEYFRFSNQGWYLRFDTSSIGKFDGSFGN